MKALRQTQDVDGNNLLDNTTLLIGGAMADASSTAALISSMLAGGGYQHKDITAGKRSHRSRWPAILFTVLHLGFEQIDLPQPKQSKRGVDGGN